MCQDASHNPQNALKPVGNSLDEELGIEKSRESDFRRMYQTELLLLELAGDLQSSRKVEIETKVGCG